MNHDLSGYPDITTLSDRSLVARKDYKCDATGRRIEVGTRYRRIVQIVDGDLFTMRLS